MKTLVLGIAIVAGCWLGQGQASCTLSAADVRAWDAPDTVTADEMDAAKLKVLNFEGCSGRPDAASRSRFFHVVEKEFTFPYVAVRQRWVASGKMYTEDQLIDGEADTQIQFERELLRYLDKNVDRDDVEFKSVILQFGTGRAIAALGRPVKDDVLRQLALPTVTYGAISHNPQEESFKAIGYWIDDDDHSLTLNEKRSMQSLLLEALPPKASITGGRMQSRVTNAVIEALGHSSDPHVADAVEQWGNGLGDNRPLKIKAEKCASNVRQRGRK